MPIYEYQCESCGKTFEVWQKISDDPLKTCQSCGGTVKKLISHTSFQLKGSGWYVTDYARKTESKKKDSSKEGAKGEKKEK
ncbi:FmdB family zinc ribbon protein [Thermosulfuriphilus sp.]